MIVQLCNFTACLVRDRQFFASLWYSEDREVLRRRLPDVVRLRLKGEESYKDKSLDAFATPLDDQLVELEEDLTKIFRCAEFVFFLLPPRVRLGNLTSIPSISDVSTRGRMLSVSLHTARANSDTSPVAGARIRRRGGHTRRPRMVYEQYGRTMMPHGGREPAVPAACVGSMDETQDGYGFEGCTPERTS